jgi:N-acylneuraminate cytidylyltransferase
MTLEASENSHSDGKVVIPKRALCLIPARAGSKRIARKNVRAFAGKPMIYWPLVAALESNVFNQVVVSTDDSEIADIAKAIGAFVPFYRDDHLADDYATTAMVTIDALRQLASIGLEYDYVCCLYPTAVFTTADDLQASYKALVSAGSCTCLAVTQYHATPFRAMIKDDENRLTPAMSIFQLTRSQDMPEAWHDAGQFCWSCTDQIVKDGQVSMSNAIGHEMRKYSVVDIDEEEDLVFAQQLFILRSTGRQ